MALIDVFHPDMLPEERLTSQYRWLQYDAACSVIVRWERYLLRTLGGERIHVG
ncbi:MAG: hypothetical protein ACI9ON_004273 [Limisphaerales bacterium]|jgi:hypothetical protein